MIRINNNVDDIIKLWAEAFGDGAEDIIYFADNIRKADCFIYYVDDIPVAMLYLVDCSIDGRAAKYIYAACTAENYRGKGYMSQLLDYCKNNYNCICLIPANDRLIDYYAARGFTERINISTITFDECDEIKEYLFDGYKLTKPMALLRKGE